MRVAFRVDSSGEIGAGHVMRCVTLAEALRANGCDVEFLCRDERGNLSSWIRSRDIGVVPFDGRRPIDEAEDARATIDALLRRPADLLVVDHYRLGEPWERAVREVAPRIMAIDDLPGRTHCCDFYLDQNLHGRDAKMAGGDAGRVDMLGPKYALLRSQFAERRAARDIVDAMRSIVVFFGAGDNAAMLEAALSALAPIAGGGLSITVVANQHIARGERLRSLCNAMPGCEIRSHVDDMAELLAGTDLAIGAGGVSSLERCCLGVPSLVVAVADNQLGPSTELARLGCQIYLGRAQDVDAGMFEAAVRLLSDNASLRSHLARQGMKRVDGKGVQRVVNRLLERTVSLQPADMSHADMILKWRNDEAVRLNSLDPEPIGGDEHRGWMSKTLADPKRCLLVGRCDERPVGVLRYDISEDTAGVSIFLDPAATGRRIGPAMLAAGERWLAMHRPRVKRLRADVLERNSDSQKAFEKAGFEKFHIEYVKRV